MSSERWVLIALCVFAGCRPDFGLPVSVVLAPRILSVSATPPEARPGSVVQVVASAGGPDGALDARADFAFCASARPLVESNVVNSDCFGAQGAVRPIASGVESTPASIPDDACLLFGPETPPQRPGEPPFRARDPDVTGGYYVPVKVTLPSGLEAIELVRLRCNLPGASAQRAVEYSMRYVDNTNPAVATLTLEHGGGALDPQQVPANSEVTLRATWDAAAAEAFVVHDRTNDSLVEHREALRVSWFTTAGVIPIVTTGRGEDDLALDTETIWQTPATGSGTIWAVLRDNRGGTSIRSLSFQVR
jgi:hypothetical protein